MNRAVGAILLSILGALCLWGVRIFLHEQEQRRAMDAYVDAKLSHNLTVPLDCPPLGRLNVTFDVEGVDNTDLTAFNLPNVVEQWSVIWPKVYAGLLAATNDYRQDEKQQLTQKVGIQVDLPNALINNNADWQIEYNCSYGYFLSEIKGYVVGDTHLGG